MVRTALHVAEKPSVARELASILGGGNAHNTPGVSRYNPVHEFTALLDNAPCKMKMTSVVGHLLEMDFTEAYRSWRSTNPIDLFEAPITETTREDLQDVRKNLEKHVRGCTDLILWLDCDREGEAIGFEVIGVCQAVQPHLRVRRARFSALIPRDIHHALAHLVPPDQRQSDAVLARQEVDLRLGAAFTRLQTLALQNKFEGLEQMLSYGPCQFPTMWFVAQRADRIAAFRSESFWQIEMEHTRRADDGEQLHVRFSWSRTRLFDRLATLVLYELCVERGTASITSVTAKPTSKRRPLPLSTVEFQRLASSQLHIASDQTMDIAEKLYQSGYLSYPRTETDSFKEGFDLLTLIRTQLADQRWAAYTQRLLDGDFQWPIHGGKDDNAHPPIHPCKSGTDLSGDEARLYELVARRFLACCSKDALGHETVVRAELAGEEFSAHGLMVLERNYLDVYQYDRWTAKKIPTFHVGEHFVPTRLEMAEGMTTPPSYLSESDLIHLMETHSIGTDATIAEHIKTVVKRSYVEKRGQHFHPTTVGRMLLKGYVDVGFDLGKPELRAEMERAINRVASGERTRAAAVGEIVALMKPLFAKASRSVQVLVAAAAAAFAPTDTTNWPRSALADGSQPACGACGTPMEPLIPVGRFTAV